MNVYFKVPLLSLMLCLGFLKMHVFAQNKDHVECLTEFTEEDQLQFDQSRAEMKARNFHQRLNDQMVLIPVTYHITRTSSGTGGVTQQQVDEAMERVNGIYEQFGMSFYQCGPTLIHNQDNLYDYDRDLPSSFLTPMDVANTYNIYFCNTVGTACGFAYYPGGSPDRTVLKSSCITSGTTLEHEIGHSFNLPHTHGGSKENVARPGEGSSNCITAGDGFCDTEADPSLSGQTQSTATCDVSDLGNGPDGLPYRADGKNIMSYAPRKNCRTVFSQEQMDMMYFTASQNSDRTKFTCSDVPTANFDAAISRITCVGDEIQLEDLSEGNQPFGWNWTFAGGSVSNNLVENPIVSYGSVGEYAVTLAVSNNQGNDSETKTGFIKVIDPFIIPYNQDFSSGVIVLDDFYVETNSQSQVLINTTGGETDNGLVLTSKSTDIYYVKARKEKAFHNNPAYTSSVTIPCLDATNASDLTLSFDLKLLYSSNRFYTTFRILVNGEQLGETYNVTSNGEEVWNTINEDISAYAGDFVYITFEANTRSENFNSVFIDNISVTGTANLKPTITSDDQPLFCDGGSTLLVADIDEPGNFTYQWRKDGSDIVGAISDTFTATESGTYTVQMVDGAVEGESNGYYVDVVQTPGAPNVSTIPSCGPGVVTLTAQGEFGINWYEAIDDIQPISTGEIYEVNLAATSQIYVQSKNDVIKGSVGPVDTTFGQGGIHSGGFYLVFDALKSFTIKSAKVYAEGTKIRTLELKDAADNILVTKEILIQDGESIIAIDLLIPEGSGYQIGFSSGAGLYRSNINVAFPYNLDGLVSILESSASSPLDFYYYLYNWEVEEDFPECYGERILVDAVVIPRPEAPQVDEPETVCGGPWQFELEAIGTGQGQLQWYESQLSDVILAVGSIYSTEELSESEDYFVEEVIEINQLNSGGSTIDDMENGGIHAGGFYLIFDANEPFVLKSATVYSEEAKDRTLEARDSTGTVILATKVVSIPLGESKIDIDFAIPAGEGLQIGFTTGADLFRTNVGVAFPYEIGDVVQIKSSTATSNPSGFYYYLYDWEIENSIGQCVGEKSEINITIDVCTETVELEEMEFSVYPNPTSGNITFTYEGNLENLEILNEIGESILWTTEDLYEYDFSDLASGVYFLTATIDNRQLIRKIVVK